MSRSEGQKLQFDRSASTSEPMDNGLLQRLNAVRLIVVLIIGFGYASTMSIGPEAAEWGRLFGYDPSWFGVQVLFFLSGYLAWRSLNKGRTLRSFFTSRARRILPWVAIYTFIVAAILYPLLCNHDAPTVMTVSDLATYWLRTVTLLDPGGPLPGALDEALYTCLLQGTIWTLRWGAVAYIGLVLAYKAGLRSRLSALILFIGSLCGYLVIGTWTVRTGSDLFAPVEPGLRLAYPFLLGAVVHAFEARFDVNSKHWLTIGLISLIGALLHYAILPWTHLIEVLATTGWCALSMALLRSRFGFLKDWPDLVLPTYLGVWPLAQLILWLLPEISVPALIVITLCISVIIGWSFRMAETLVRQPVHRRVQAT